MATLRQRARMDALRSALELHRHRHFNAGCNLVVLGGACAPSTKIDTSVCDNSDHEDFASSDFASPQSLLSPGTPLGRHLVGSGGDIATAHTHLNSPIVTFVVCATASRQAHRNFRPRPSHPPCTDAIYAVVPGHFQLWPRTGVG